tara:strand:- start:5986 stop:6255 length:270 start_codon:yes stop_codon:yes gene_type:complete
MRNIEKEIELLKQMIKFNLEMVEGFEQSLKQQRNVITQLEQQGMSKGTIKRLEDHHRDNKVRLNQVNSQILNVQIPKMKVIIRDLDYLK